MSRQNRAFPTAQQYNLTSTDSITDTDHVNSRDPEKRSPPEQSLKRFRARDAIGGLAHKLHEWMSLPTFQEHSARNRSWFDRFRRPEQRQGLGGGRSTCKTEENRRRVKWQKSWKLSGPRVRTKGEGAFITGKRTCLTQRPACSHGATTDRSQHPPGKLGHCNIARTIAEANATASGKPSSPSLCQDDASTASDTGTSSLRCRARPFLQANVLADMAAAMA